MGGSRTGSLIVMDIILLIAFIGLIMVIFDLKRFFFIGELILFGVILLFTFIAMVAAYLEARFGWVLLSIISAVILLDVIFIYFKSVMSSSMFFLLVILGVVGFIISVVNMGREEAEPEIEEVFEPGKFIGSTTGRSYHAPKCDWANNIKKENQVWFDSEEEAKKKGYKAHSCLK